MTTDALEVPFAGHLMPPFVLLRGTHDHQKGQLLAPVNACAALIADAQDNQLLFIGEDDGSVVKESDDCPATIARHFERCVAGHSGLLTAVG